MRVDFFNLWLDKYLSRSTVAMIFGIVYTRSGGKDAELITVRELFFTLLNFQMRITWDNHKRMARKKSGDV